MPNTLRKVGKPRPKKTQVETPDTAMVGLLDSGRWSACFGLSYRDFCLHDLTGPQRVVRPGGGELRVLTGSGGIPTSRNKVVRRWLTETSAPWLWFVDSDMGFAADTLDRLITAADPVLRPVVGALCFAGLRRRPESTVVGYAERFWVQPTAYEYVELDDQLGFRPMIDYPRDQVFQVAATGAACLVIHRDAAEAVRAEYGPAWFDPITHPTGLNGGPRTFSEDMSFCVRLAGVGVSVHVDSRVKTTHEKGHVFLDEDTFFRQQAFAALEPKEQS